MAKMGSAIWEPQDPLAERRGLSRLRVVQLGLYVERLPDCPLVG